MGMGKPGALNGAARSGNDVNQGKAINIILEKQFNETLQRGLSQGGKVKGFTV